MTRKGLSLDLDPHKAKRFARLARVSNRGCETLARQQTRVWRARSIARSFPAMGHDSVTWMQQSAPPWAARLRRMNNWLLYDLGGGPRPLKFAWLIDTHKACTLAVLAALVWFYAGRTPAATSSAAFVYVGLHGGYGLAWLLKAVTFPDPNWQVKITLPSSVVVLVSLTLYWSMGWLLISGRSTPHYPLDERIWLSMCIVLCILGLAIMLASDAQKFFSLRVRRGLITDGMFRYVRHPNYLGEMMIYAALALIVWHWFPVLLLAGIWVGLFAVNMAMKEASMSRYPEWQAYRARSWWIIPGLL